MLLTTHIPFERNNNGEGTQSNEKEKKNGSEHEFNIQTNIDRVCGICYDVKFRLYVCKALKLI